MQNDTHALLKLLKNHAHIQIKTTRFRLTHHFTPIRMVIIKKMQSVGKNVENWNPRTFLMGIWCNRCGKLNTELPQKVKPRLIHIVVWQKWTQHCTVINLQFKNKKKKKKNKSWRGDERQE